MGAPTKGDVHVNAPLTNISIAYLQNAANFIASKVFPNVPVGKQSDRYYTYDRGEMNRDEMKERAPGTESAGGSYKLDSTPTYYARVYAFHKDIPDQVRANSDSQIAPDRDATVYCSTKALIKREKLFAGKYFTTGVWDTEKAGASAASGTEVLYWNNSASIPITDIQNGSTAILESTGFEPNTLVLGKKVYDVLKNHPEIIDRLDRGQTPNGPAMSNIAAMMALFEVERIFVMKGIENTVAESTADFDFEADNTPSYFNHQFIGGKHALLCYSAPSPGLQTPTAGYTFSWTGWMGVGNEGNRIKRFRMEKFESDRVEIQMAFDQKLVAADLGYFFYNVIE